MPLISPNAILDPLAAAAQGPRPATQAPTPAPVRQPDPRQGPLGFVAPPAYANAPDAIKRQAAFVEYLNAYDRAKRQADLEREMTRKSGSVDAALRSIATARKFIAQRQLAADLEAGMPLAQALPKNVNAWFGDKTIGPSAMRFMSDIQGEGETDFRSLKPRPVHHPITGELMGVAAATGKGSDQLVLEPGRTVATENTRLMAYNSALREINSEIARLEKIVNDYSPRRPIAQQAQLDLKELRKDRETYFKEREDILRRIPQATAPAQMPEAGGDPVVEAFKKWAASRGK